MDHVVSVRVPANWCGRLTSDQLREWILDWVANPVPFNHLPPPGPYKISIRLTQREFDTLKRVRRKNISEVIRGVAALNMPVAEQTKEMKVLSGILGVASALVALFSAGRTSQSTNIENC